MVGIQLKTFDEEDGCGRDEQLFVKGTRLSSDYRDVCQSEL